MWCCSVATIGCIGAATGVTCLYLTCTVLSPMMVRCTCQDGGKKMRREENDGGSSTVTVVLTADGGSWAGRVCGVSLVPSVFHYTQSPAHTQACDFKRFIYLYSHLMQVLYQHLDRRKWRTHGNACEPRNNTLWKKEREREREKENVTAHKICYS